MGNDHISIITQRLREMRLPMMADQLISLVEDNEIATMSAIQLLDSITEAEFISRKSNTVERLRKLARFSQSNARLHDINYDPQRRINQAVIQQLGTNDYILKQRNVLLLGATGSGKSYIANALGHHACEAHYSVLYVRMFEIISELSQAKLTGETKRIYHRYISTDVLIIDDFLIYRIHEQEIVDLFRIIEYRHNKKSTILCSQFDPVEWHTRLGGDPLAESIIDRIKSNAYQMILSGDSLR